MASKIERTSPVCRLHATWSTALLRFRSARLATERVLLPILYKSRLEATRLRSNVSPPVSELLHAYSDCQTYLTQSCGLAAGALLGRPILGRRLRALLTAIWVSYAILHVLGPGVTKLHIQRRHSWEALTRQGISTHLAKI